MDVTSHCNGSDATEGGANKSPVQSECISSQPTANGTLPHHNTAALPAAEAPPLLSDRSEDSSDDSVTDSCSTNDVSRLLPGQPASSPRRQRGVDASSGSPPPPPPVVTPPSSSSTSPPPPLRPSRSSTCNRHSCSLPHHHHHQRHSTNQTSSSQSHAPTDAAHIKEVAGDDCCVHCLLACLFCEVLSMCSAVGECLACGVGGAGCCDSSVGCCCCVEAAGEAACTEEACQAVLDCGIVEDCCGSSDCMEICLECCSICFPS